MLLDLYDRQLEAVAAELSNPVPTPPPAATLPQTSTPPRAPSKRAFYLGSS